MAKVWSKAEQQRLNNITKGLEVKCNVDTSAYREIREA